MKQQQGTQTLLGAPFDRFVLTVPQAWQMCAAAEWLDSCNLLLRGGASSCCDESLTAPGLVAQFE